MSALVLLLAVLLAVSYGQCRRLRRVVSERDARIELIEASWATLAAKYARLDEKRSEERPTFRVPTNEEIEQGVW